MSRNPAPAILVINAGSSSIKFALFSQNDESSRLDGQIENIGNSRHTKESTLKWQHEKIAVDAPNHETALALIFERVVTNANVKIIAIGHRVVHGGDKFHTPCKVDNNTIKTLGEITYLAPQHMPHHIEAMKTLAHRLPNVPQVACFDTTFHQTQDPHFVCPALPEEYQHYKRYGFHGLSYQHVVEKLATFRTKPYENILVAHLGNGASLCAIKNGKSIATTMGFSTLDGVVMGTRSGALDPGLLLHLLLHENISPEKIQYDLYHRSGLLGLSNGYSSHMKNLLDALPYPDAEKAVKGFVHSVVRHAGGLIALMNGVDAFAFTGGIGEHASEIRERIITKLSFFGFVLDDCKNRENCNDLISSNKSRKDIWVIKADEESVIVKHTKEIALAGNTASVC